MSVIDTAYIGNRDAGRSHSFVSQTAHAVFLGVRWDGVKVRGIRVDMSVGTSSRMIPEFFNFVVLLFETRNLYALYSKQHSSPSIPLLLSISLKFCVRRSF